MWLCWSSLAVTDFWDNWTLGPFEGLVRNSFLANSDKMLSLISIMLGNRKFERHFVTQAVDLDSGEVVVFDETIPKEIMPSVILSTGTMPVFFEPQIHNR